MFDKMLQRTKAQSIVEFVMNGGDREPVETPPLETRVRNAENSAFQAIEQKFAYTKESDKLIETVSNAFGEIEKVYFEAGFKAGATALFNMISK